MFGLDNASVFILIVILIAAVYYTIQYAMTIIDRRNARKHGMDPLAPVARDDEDEDEDDD